MIRILFYTAVLIRILTQMFSGDSGYFTGVYVFDAFALIYISTLVGPIERKVILFCAGCAFYEIIKPLFRHPAINYIDEFIAFWLGIVLLIFEVIYYKYVNNNHFKRH